MDTQYDVIVAGSGPAGCSTAILYAMRGMKVALIERKKEVDSYKPVCTHFVQGCAIPTLREMGVMDQIKASGAVRNDIHIWTRFGWIKPRPENGTDHHGYVIRRQTLDPILRKNASAHPNIDLYLGWKLETLSRNEQGKVVGATILDLSGRQRLALRAFLTVGAEGRNSEIAQQIGASHTSIPNRRTFFVTYYRDLKLASGRVSQLWFWKNDIAYAFPSDGDVTLLCLGVHENNLRPFKDSTEEAFHRYFAQLPDGPDMQAATRVAPVTRGKNMHTIRRYYTTPGVALVGDALFAIDPFAGTGIGWAIEASGWLVNQTAEAIRMRSSDLLEKSLQQYQQMHCRRLHGHAWMISNYSSGRDFNLVFPPERLLFAAAAQREDIAGLLDRLLNRVVSLKSLLSLRVIAVLLVFAIRQCFVREPEKTSSECMQ